MKISDEDYQQLCQAFYAMPQHRWQTVLDSYQRNRYKYMTETHEEVCALCGWRAFIVDYMDAATVACERMTPPRVSGP